MSLPLAKKRSSVTVSAVGGPPPIFPGPGDPVLLAERMVAHWEREISAVLPNRPDLIVLPEMCDRYDETPRELLEELHPAIYEKTSRALARLAREHRCYIVHSTKVACDDGCWRNAAVLLDRTGKRVASYYKNYLVVTEIERGLVPGAKPCVVECDFGRVGFAICFDLNFVELLESYRKLKPDLIVFPSRYHGGIMQPYWAFEARAHFVGCMGKAANPSSLYSPVGQLLASSTNYFNHVTARVNLDCAVVHLDFHWEKLRALKEHYGPDVVVSDPGQLGAVLVSSESSIVSVSDMLRKFQIETLDEYLGRSRERNESARF